MTEHRRWYRCLTPNIRDEFNRYLLVEDVGDECLYLDPITQVMKSHNPPEYEYRTFMVHQERDNNGSGFPIGDWWERDRFEISRHLINGHYGEVELPNADALEAQTAPGWITDELIIYSDSPAFLAWEVVSQPDAYDGVDPRVKSLVCRDTALEGVPENEPAPR